MAEIVVSAEGRTDRGKNAARRLRVKGLIPAVVYGGKGDALSVAVDPKVLLRVLRSETGRNTILKLDLGAEGKTSAILKQWQLDPVKESFLHADFYRIAMDVALRVKVPIAVKGEARGVKTDGVILELIMRFIEVECLPGDIPERIEIDVTDLGINDSLRISNVLVNAKIKVMEEQDQVVVHVIAVKEEAAPVAGAAPAAEGEAPAGTAEPEVLKKGKKEEEPPAGKE
jgi:large subunit ribosomal protein L25